MSLKKKPLTAAGHARSGSTPTTKRPAPTSQQQQHAPLPAAPLPPPPVGATLLNPYAPGIGSVSSASLCWHNLLLLGFDPVAESARNSTIGSGKIDLSQNMFDRPNARGMHLLLHWLLVHIKGCPQSERDNDTSEWKEMLSVFQHAYPCIDRNQIRDFITVCVGVLLGFEKGPASVFPPGTIRKSHFAAPQGERLYVIFWQLSSYALQLTLQRDYPSYAVPSMQLPPLNEPGLFPHLIKAMKSHIARQSQNYISKLARMQVAEDGWRTHAADITREYNDCQAQLAQLTPAAPPRIPGQPHPEIESDKMLFSAQAHADRTRKLQAVKQLHVELDSLHAKTEQQRTTLNLVLNRSWQPMSISRLQLEKLMQPASNASADSTSTAAPAKPAASSQPSTPLDFHSIVTQWNASLAQIQRTLMQYLDSPASNSSSSQYLSGLHQSAASVEQHVKEHTVKLSNLRTLSHHVRSSLIPELEADLLALQRELTRAGSYSGPIAAPPPSLIPPTPFKSNHASTSLVVPPTPLMKAAGAGSNRIPFTPSSIPSNRAPSRINDSVRRAVHRGAARGAGAMHQQQRDMLHTIADEEHLASPAAAAPQQHRSADSTSTALLTPEGDLSALSSPLGGASGISNGHATGEDLSPQFSKKLVFSPAEEQRRRASMGHDFSPPPPTAVSSGAYSNRSSLSPSLQQQQQAASAASWQTSPPAQHSAAAHPSSVSSARSFASPATQQLGEGLLGDEELFSASSTSPLNRTADSDGFVQDVRDDEEDDEDEEVVFGAVSPDARPEERRRSATAAGRIVDPDAPTPQVAQRTHRAFVQHTPATTRPSNASVAMSPAYQIDGQGLLDDF